MTQLPAQFYPIAPDLKTTEKYIKAGIKFLQIRLKEISHTQIKHSLSQAIQLAKHYNVALVINDYWQYALDYQAEWLHLGQEDLEQADVTAIQEQGIKLGISTHDKSELKIALAHNPDYVALGPIYFTQLKAMKWAPQGLDKIQEWKTLCGQTPLVAIGGITLERALNVLDKGADCVSFVTDITHNTNPDNRLKQWITKMLDSEN